MALNATVYSFEINLSDLDRKIYQALAFRVAKHPSETDAYLMTRVLAYCLEYREGLRFSKGGLSDPDAEAQASQQLGDPIALAEEAAAAQGICAPSRQKHRLRTAVPKERIAWHLLGKCFEDYATRRERLAELFSKTDRRANYEDNERATSRSRTCPIPSCRWSGCASCRRAP